jgi:hypothetical protein
MANPFSLPQYTIGDALNGKEAPELTPIEKTDYMDSMQSAIDQNKYFKLFMENFKNLIFFVGMIILVGTFTNQKGLNIFLLLLLFGILISNVETISNFKM